MDLQLQSFLNTYKNIAEEAEKEFEAICNAKSDTLDEGITDDVMVPHYELAKTGDTNLDYLISIEPKEACGSGLYPATNPIHISMNADDPGIDLATDPVSKSKGSGGYVSLKDDELASASHISSHNHIKDLEDQLLSGALKNIEKFPSLFQEIQILQREREKKDKDEAESKERKRLADIEKRNQELNRQREMADKSKRQERDNARLILQEEKCELLYEQIHHQLQAVERVNEVCQGISNISRQVVELTGAVNRFEQTVKLDWKNCKPVLNDDDFYPFG